MTGFRTPDKKYVQIAMDIIEQISIMSRSFRSQLPTEPREMQRYVNQWGRLMEELRNYPDFVLYDAVDQLFKSEDGNNYNITTGNYFRAVERAMDKANQNPDKRKHLEEARLRRTAEHEKIHNPE